MTTRRLAAGLLALSLTAPLPALAADATPEQAKALEQQLRTWLQETVGPLAKLPDQPVELKPEGDHYAVRIGLGTLKAPDGQPAAITAAAKPLEGGRWALDAIRLPAALQATIKVSGEEVKKIPGANGQAEPGEVTGTVTVKIAEQASHAVFDPTYATESTLAAKIGGVDIHVDSPMGAQNQRIESEVANISLKPRGADRLDVVQDAAVEGFHINQKMPDGNAVLIEFGKIRGAGHLDGLAKDRLGALVRAIADAATAIPSSEPGKPKAKYDPAKLRQLVLALQGIALGGQFEESIEGARVEAAGHRGSLDKVMFGAGVATPQDRLDLDLTIAMEGLHLPELPAQYAEFVPQRVLLHPVLTGVSLADLNSLLMNATDPDPAKQAALETDMAALLMNPRQSLGVERFALEMGPLQMEGSGKVSMGPNGPQGEALIRAKGFEALMAKARTVPDAEQAMPVLILARGLAKPDGDALVWNVTYTGGAVMVNGTDLSKMMGEEKPAKKPGAGRNAKRQR